MGQLLSNLANGSLVKLNENTKPTKFIKLDNDHYGTGTGVTLIRKDAFSGSHGTPPTATATKTVTDLHPGQLPVTASGPLKLDEKIRECLVPVPIVVAEGNQVSTLHTIYRKRALPSPARRRGVSGWQTEGKAFSYFSDNAKRIAYLDETATAVVWGLRSPGSDGGFAYSIGTVGTVYYDVVFLAGFAPRPALILNLLSLYLTAKTAMDATRLRACRAATAGCM